MISGGAIGSAERRLRRAVIAQLLDIPDVIIPAARRSSPVFGERVTPVLAEVNAVHAIELRRRIFSQLIGI